MAALLAVFPTPESLVRFSADSDNEQALLSFIDYAAKNNLIRGKDFQSLKTLITDHARSPENFIPPDQINFEELLENREKRLRIALSLRSLTGRINSLIKDSGIALPPISNSMLVRLKTKPADTASKQSAIRSLAFWLGHERIDLGPLWNYETLIRLCPQDKPPEHYTEGARIGLSLSSRGDVIDHAVMNELKTSIKNHIEQAMGALHGPWGKVRSHDFTTLYVDIPKQVGFEDPASYRLCLTMAASLAHQISLRWALSRYCTRNRFLSIGIVAGEYSSLDNYLLPILNAKLSGDPVIRVSDYVRQCMLISDIRVLFCRQPSETILFNGESFSIWWIVAFWSYMYFNFIPELLEERILKNNPSSEKTLSQLLWFPEESGYKSVEDVKTNAITKFFRFPQNSLLGIEIAKTLYYRRRFQEAIEILRIVLSIDPTDPTARTLRMILLRELAINSPSYFIANQFFQQSEHEALSFLEDCETKSEDFYCEYASLFLAKAMLTVRYLRKRSGSRDGIPDIAQAKQAAFEAFDKAEYWFERAVKVSPSAIRSTYSLNITRTMRAILKDDETIFVSSEKPIDGKPEIVTHPSSGFQWQLSLIKNGVIQDDMQQQNDFLEKILAKRFRLHDDSISLPVCRANTRFSHAVALWDFFPTRTVAIARRVLNILHEAMEIAEDAAKEDICLYAATRGYSEMMPAEDFIRHMKKSIQMVSNVAGANLSQRDDREIIKTKGHLSSILLTLNF